MRRILVAINGSGWARGGPLLRELLILTIGIVGDSSEKPEDIAAGAVERDARKTSLLLLDVSVAGGISGELHFFTA
jgi:hypothetical protein